MFGSFYGVWEPLGVWGGGGPLGVWGLGFRVWLEGSMVWALSFCGRLLLHMSERYGVA